MNISEELISRFFQGKCSPEEAAAVLKHFELHPEAEEHYIGKNEWDNLTASQEAPLSDEQTKRMYTNIKSATRKKPTYQWAVAAMILLLALGTGLLFYKNNKPIPVIAKTQESWKSIDNQTANVMELTLKDGTGVKLYAHSKISFPIQFQSDKRDVKLTGKAFFKVVKDKTRPFTVFSGNISTTALGTQFTINAPDNNGTISVKLHEGKVVIKTLTKDKPHSPVYLIPEQELVYNNNTGTATVSHFEEAPLIKTVKKQPVNLTRHNGISITFNREPVKNVFTALEKAYHIDLTYPESELKDYNFTGSFNKNDSLTRILQIITETNKLQLIKTKSGYLIKKSH
ncbi:FecR domain-containing protein [Pedobacter sp. NJ-S-72]